MLIFDFISEEARNVSDCELFGFLLLLLLLWLLLLFAFISYYIVQNAKYFAMAGFELFRVEVWSQSDVVRS